MKTSNRELQNRNDQLDARNRVLSGLVDCTDTALIALNANGHVLRINPAAESRFKLDTSAIGRPVSECLDRSLLDRLGQDARTDAAEYRRRVQDSQGNRYMRTARPDGDRADANIFLSFQPVEASPEEVTGHDAAQFEAVMEAVPAAVLIAHDVECRQITGNSAGYEMLNAPAGCNVSQSSRGRSRPHYRVYQNDRELSHEELPMQKACATGEAVTGVELRLVFEDGTERIVFGNAVPLFNGGHRVRGCVAAFVDISQVERVNQRVRELNRELGRMVQARASRIREQSRKVRRLAWRLAQAEQRERQRIAQMLHDHLQQLLVGAQFHIASSRRKKDPASMRQSLGDLDDLLAQALAATRDLSLELSPPVLREEGLVEASHWIAKQMREQNGLAVHVHVETHFEPAEQRERTLLFECLRELLLNVAKHSGGQRADVTLRCRGGAFEICVRDSGKGFDPESVAASQGEHFGLLSIRQRVEVVGGQMQIESAPGKGTEITLQCPVTGEPQGEESPDSDVIRVLIADDHAVVRQGLREMLVNEENIEIVGEAGDGCQAVEMARSLRPGAILMDINMPGISGTEATRRVHESFPEVVVIGLSISDDPEVRDQTLQAGAMEYLTKTSTPEQIIQAIRRAAAGVQVG